MIVIVDESNLPDAGRIHSESWKESHRSFCSEGFVEKHTPEAQTDYLRQEIKNGKQAFMLIDGCPVGIVSIHGSLIENLYVLPQKQNRGYGEKLLRFAMGQCAGIPTLWVLNINEGAYRLYTRSGFEMTGNRKQLNEKLCELEMQHLGK